MKVHLTFLGGSMAIRYDANYNKEISRVVKNFNQKRNRAIKRGFKSVPAPIKVSDLKARYTTRKEMDKQLGLFAKFSAGRDSVLEKVENQGGAKAIEWELEYLKANEKAAREFLVREYKRIAPKTVNFPGERMRLDNIMAKINMLDMDLAYMNQKQFNAYRSTINEYLNKPKSYAAGYRGFLSEVEMVMKYLNFGDDDIKKFFDKFNELTPEQFQNLYDESDLIARIFRLADSPTVSEFKLTTTDDDAKELIDIMLDEADDLVKKAKEEPEWMNESFSFDSSRDARNMRIGDPDIPEVVEFSKPYKKRDRIVREDSRGRKITSKGKYAKSSLSKEEIKGLKAIGWGDLIDEDK